MIDVSTFFREYTALSPIAQPHTSFGSMAALPIPGRARTRERTSARLTRWTLYVSARSSPRKRGGVSVNEKMSLSRRCRPGETPLVRQTQRCGRRGRLQRYGCGRRYDSSGRDRYRDADTVRAALSTAGDKETGATTVGVPLTGRAVDAGGVGVFDMA